MNDMKRVFISGSDGMLGSDVVRELKKKKEYQISLWRLFVSGKTLRELGMKPGF